MSSTRCLDRPVAADLRRASLRYAGRCVVAVTEVQIGISQRSFVDMEQCLNDASSTMNLMVNQQVKPKVPNSCLFAVNPLCQHEVAFAVNSSMKIKESRS